MYEKLLVKDLNFSNIYEDFFYYALFSKNTEKVKKCYNNFLTTVCSVIIY